MVDQHGRVHGITGLRVTGTSILPTAPTLGPAATAILIRELIAAKSVKAQVAEVVVKFES